MRPNGASRIVSGILLAAALSVGGSAPAAAQIEIEARGASLRIGGRLQTQFAHSSVAGAPGADFLIRRGRVTFDATLNEWVSGRVQHDFASGSLKDTYVRFTAGSGLRVDVGHFKRSFDLFMLQSSSDISVIERDGRIPGYPGGEASGCSGVGNACSAIRLTDKLEYSDRDLGLRLQGSLSDRLSYQASLTNGTGLGGDENGAKSPAGRLVFALTDRIRLGVNAAAHDYVGDEGDTEYGAAWGGDLEVGSFEAPGLHLQAGVVGGDNWKVRDDAGEAAAFLTAQAILSYHRPTGSSGLVQAVEPLARISWADPDTEVDDDGGLLLTPGFMVFFARRNKIGANVDIYSPDQGDTEWSLKVQSYFYF